MDLQPTSDESNFDLYLKSREIEQAAKVLRDVASKGRRFQRQWAKDNHDSVDRLMEDFISDSVFIMDGMKLDGEGLDLSVKLMTNLRETIGTLHHLLHEQE